MAIRDSLQTSAPSLGELFTNGRQFRVPDFQRNYSWTATEWQDLWDDAIGSHEHGADHYLGAIVLQRSRGPELVGRDGFEVIDGQQRLTTLSILVLAIIEELQAWADAGLEPEANRARAALLRERLVAPRDPSSLMVSSRLRLNRHDDGFYQSALVNGEPPVNVRRLRRSEQALWGARAFFRDRVRERFGGEHNGAALAAFVDQTLTRRLVFIEIVVDDEAAAYTVFETLNSRGVALGTADLIKNYLFARAATGSGADLEELRRRWDALTDVVRLEQLADLAHDVANTRALNVSRRDVFRRVRQEVADKPAAFDYLRRLTAAADWYAALLDPQDERWHEYRDARKWARVLTLLGAEQHRPAALAAAPLLKDQPLEMARLFKMLAIYTLRGVIFARLNSGDVYRTWNKVAVQVTATGDADPAVLARLARPIYGDDEAVRQGFASMALSPRGVRKKLLRYLLASLEEDASQKPVDWETDAFTVEHIRPGSERDDGPRLVERIGNYLPLEASRNRDASDRPFPEKVPIYQGSGYALPRGISGGAWSDEAILARSEHLARRALAIWRFDL